MIEKQDIKRYLPHREPFLFVDGVTEIIKDEYIKGTLLTIIATFITSMIKENNVIHKLFMKHTILRYILYLSIFIWFAAGT